ncbi:MAG: VOC family protein [Sinomicrobium sp.]|nr:VOC family protein [Sinomicrobium sp.]
MKPFEIAFLDHVAIRVKDLEVSAAWYEKALGLKRLQLPEWGAFPIFMLSGKTGIALFPAAPDATGTASVSKNVRIDHFAFNVHREHFENAKKHYETLGIAYDFQEHCYFHSIYTKDPDGHTVELTTLTVDERDFYNAAPTGENSSTKYLSDHG